MGKLSGKRAIITGASRGLGEAVARRFWAQGACVGLISRSAIDWDGDHWGRVVKLQVDVGDRTAVRQSMATLITLLGGVDILVCCAGIQGPVGHLVENNMDDWAEALNVNLLGTVYACQSVLPSMLKQHQGKIITLSGGGGTSPFPNFSSYATSKAAVVRFSETIAREVSQFGVDVNCVSPGMLNTSFHDATREAGPAKAGQQYWRIKDLKGNGESMGRAVDLIEFLCSEVCDGISGRLISAVWDNWHELPSQKSALAKTDKYTLRRVV